MRGGRMKEFSIYPIFINHRSSLKETSKDTPDSKHIFYMTEDMTEVIDFDEVKKEYICSLGLSDVPASSDALLEGKGTNPIFIEFKNGQINKIVQAELKKKIYDSLLILFDILQKDNKYLIKTTKNEYFSQKVIIASGGKTLIDIISKFNIKIRKCSPSLVSLKTESTKNLSGTRLSPVVVKAINSQGQEKQECGEILFKDSGISGICIFNISTIFSRINEFKGSLCLDLLPNLSHEELYNLLIERKKLDVKVNKFFEGLFVNSIAYEILNKLKINENKSSLKLTDNELKSMIEIIKNFKFNVLDCYDNNQVFSGGVKLSELTENLEAKNTKGLYFCGEICDVDGECGGFNLQWAWTSGFIVGNNI